GTETLSESLNKGMNIIASTGSTAPFVGLLGTVLGIINAFKLISADGSGGIGTIGAAIGESLIVTGYGLVVAIPSVLLFNTLSLRLDRYEGEVLRTVHELMDRLELGEWQRVDTVPATSSTGDSTLKQSTRVPKELPVPETRHGAVA
ncbi:MAG: MotA/TolQ/ExbB proton channel family protein, partial [Myxococcales bacterium]|nr:MotA/TolQ/ExbB proton channel family protein [Myxococcales bacterium]